MRFFSVVMPLYNKKDYVKKSILSVLNQTYPHFELIVVDDGSNDGSDAVVKSIDDERIVYIRQKNSGASAARNLGMSLAKHEHIAFLDSDDLWRCDFLETMNDLLKKYAGVGAAGCAFLHEKAAEGTLDRAEEISKENKELLIQNYFEFALSHNQTLIASTTVVCKNVINKIGGFPVGLKNWEDLDFWTRVGLYYNIAFTNRVCAVYNDVSDGASKTQANLHAPVFDNYKKYLRDKEVPNSRKPAFREYVFQHKLYSVYQQYMVDRKGMSAIRKALACWGTRRHRRMLLSMILQFIFTPEIFFRINRIRK